ncbi:MAG: hypothetical protein D6704_07460 [Nitrospirae bacterium]|nr:MAG: hypothetical protein D6704_07460 [Nitrospirota bacterium]
MHRPTGMFPKGREDCLQKLGFDHGLPFGKPAIGVLLSLILFWKLSFKAKPQDKGFLLTKHEMLYF